MRKGLIALCAILPIVDGCGSCTYETRYVKASGFASINGVEVATAVVTVSANRGSLTWKDFDRLIEGNSLKGHVLSIALVSADNPGVSQLDVPVDDLSRTEISSGTMIQREGETTPNLGGLYEAVSANIAVLELTTDLPSSQHVSIPLTVTERKDWYRPDNCY